ncbi:hypothetical protein [Streptomyces sp. NPDC093089]|uniref:hypothetical protein n=1 Tax=Streptomyces sp. NPDC093089 TaxID=3366024 RepID=UPI00380134F2
MDQGWAAVAGAGVGVLGAVISGLVSAAALRRQSHDQLAGSRAQWHRQLRRDAYVTFIGAARHFQAQARAVSPSLGGNEVEPVQRAVVGLRSAENALLEQAQVVDLEAPDQVVEAVASLLATAKQVVVDTSIWLELAERGDSALGTYHRRFAEDREVFGQRVDLLRDKIRQDLQGQ